MITETPTGRQALDYRLWPTADAPLDARVDIIGQSVILHSRGGATKGTPPRNTDYASALRRICQQFGGKRDYILRVMIDSDIARSAPVANRVLLDRQDIAAFGAGDLASLIGRELKVWGQHGGAKGGNPTKRVRFDINLRHSSIIQSLSARPAGNVPATSLAARKRWDPDEHGNFSRFTWKELREVKPVHIHRAVDSILAGTDAPLMGQSRDYDVLVSGGRRLAPKKVFGLALKQVYGVEPRPGHFSAGDGTPCFQTIRAAGLPIVPKARSTAPEVEEVLENVDLDENDRDFAEGDTRRANHLRRERSRKAVDEKKRRFLADHGRFFCEKCQDDLVDKFGTDVASGCFEAHHFKTAVKDMQKDHRTKWSDLMLLCANCHRAEHRRMKIEHSA